MSARGSSKTALMVAAYRGRASARPDAICADAYALALAGPEGEELAERYDRHFAHMELYLAVRTAFLDAQVRRFVAEAPRCTQVVVLGAGLDTRAARLATPGVRFFEVDQPASQADKLARVGALPGYPADAAAYVRCDFERDDFVDQLVGAGFDRGAPTLLLWEGVTYYLTEAAVRATLRRVATGLDPRSVLLFDFVGKNIVEGRKLRDHHVEAMKLVAGVGEPFLWGSNDPLPILYEEGFRHVRTTTFDEACLTLTGTYERAREFRFQHFCLGSVVPRPAGL